MRHWGLNKRIKGEMELGHFMVSSKWQIKPAFQLAETLSNAWECFKNFRWIKWAITVRVDADGRSGTSQMQGIRKVMAFANGSKPFKNEFKMKHLIEVGSLFVVVVVVGSAWNNVMNASQNCLQCCAKNSYLRWFWKSNWANEMTKHLPPLTMTHCYALLRQYWRRYDAVHTMNFSSVVALLISGYIFPIFVIELNHHQ